MPEKPDQRLLMAFVMLMAIIVTGTAVYKLLTGDYYGWGTCFYMTVITLSTVGYREVIDTSLFPATIYFNSVLILFGMGIILYCVSTAVSIMVEMDLRDVFKRRKMSKEIKQLQNHFIVCGAGATGSCIVQELLKTGTAFVVIERERERIEALTRHGEMFFIEGDATDDDILIQARIEHAVGIAAALSTEKDNLYLTLTARQLNPSIRIVARGLDEPVDRKLRKAGADAVVSPTQIGGLRMASELIRSSVVSFLDTMLRDSSGTIRFEELRITRESRLNNQTIKATKLRERSDLLIVALQKVGAPGFIYNPPADTLLTDGMTLIVLGESHQIHRAIEFSKSKV